MPADTSVKFFHSEMPGAPTLSGQAGTLIAVLDACLVNGFGSGTLDSLSVSSNVATATRAAGHPFEVGTVVEIAGATPAGLNGAHKVTAITTTTYQFETSGVADGAATGTITHKLAALGWTKQFSGTNLAAYKSTHLEATGFLLRVSDPASRVARVVAYESMSDINIGTQPFPTNAQVSGGYYWPKSEIGSDANVRAWTLVGDERVFYMWIHHGTAANFGESHVVAFGDFKSQQSGDAYNCFLSGAETDVAGSSASIACFQASSFTPASNNNSLSIARAPTGLGGALFGMRSFSPTPNYVSTAAYSGNVGMSYPNPTDNGLYVLPYLVTHPSNFRGVFPGAYFVPHFISPTQFSQRERISGLTGLPGKTLIAISNGQGPMLYDITGPWW